MSTITKGNLERGKLYSIRFDGSWINEMLGNTFLSIDGRSWYMSHIENDTMIIIEEEKVYELVYKPESEYLN